MATVKTNETEKITPTEGMTLEEVRKMNRINIVLPYVTDGDDPDHLEQYEFVTIDGKVTQIKKGVVVPVNWEVYEALKHSNDYKDQKILV